MQLCNTDIELFDLIVPWRHVINFIVKVSLCKLLLNTQTLKEGNKILLYYIMYREGV